MEKLQNLEEKLNQIDYRLRILERFFDKPAFTTIFGKNKNNMDSIRIEVLNDMRKEIKNLKLTFNNDAGTNFYNKKNITQ